MVFALVTLIALNDTLHFMIDKRRVLAYAYGNYINCTH